MTFRRLRSILRSTRKRLFPTPFDLAVRDYQRRLADARRRHASTRAIEAEFQAFTTKVLGG